MQSLEKSLEALLDAPSDPGQRLPTERSLAAQFGATRHAVRKALDQLEARGKLWRHVGRGTFAGRRQVTEPGSVSAAVPFARPREIVEARQVMEPQIAALAAVRASSAQLDAIENAFRKCAAARWQEAQGGEVETITQPERSSPMRRCASRIASRSAWPTHSPRSRTRLGPQPTIAPSRATTAPSSMMLRSASMVTTRPRTIRSLIRSDTLF